MKKYTAQELLALESHVRGLLDGGDIGGALDSIRFFVDSVLTNPRAIARVLASKELDDLCEHIAQTVPQHDDDATDDRRGTVVLASELSRAGGHEEVMQDFIALKMFEEPVSVLLTDCFDRADMSIAQEFAQEVGVPVNTAKGSDSAARLEDVCRTIRDLNPQKLVLFIHHQDSMGLCAAISASVPDKIFVHHADHHLCLGVTCDSFQHVDLANMAFENCRHDLGISENVYYPLILRKDLGRHEKPFSRAGQWKSCAVGRGDKFLTDGYAFDYASLLPQILLRTGGTHVHIGSVPDRLRVALEESFEHCGVPIGRVKFIPYAVSVAQALIDEDIDFLVGSFPIGGGKSTIEAMAAGIPLVMHQNYRHRMFCGADVAYPGAMTWSNEEQLFKILKNISSDLLSEHAKRSRDWFELHHSSASLVQAARDGSLVPQPLRTHPVNHLVAFLDEERTFKAAASFYQEQIAHLEEKSALEKQAAAQEILQLTDAMSAIKVHVAELEKTKRHLEDKLTSPRQLCRELARQVNRRLHGKGPK